MTNTARLEEFVRAQDEVYEQVRRELTAGRKQTHWMWFVFPQISGLGSSSMARRFAIASLHEARRYLQHPVLGSRLRECTSWMLEAPTSDVRAILGHPDDMKFRSSMTLFMTAAPGESLFRRALDRFFAGVPDPLTVAWLSDAGAGESG